MKLHVYMFQVRLLDFRELAGVHHPGEDYSICYQNSLIACSPAAGVEALWISLSTLDWLLGHCYSAYV